MPSEPGGNKGIKYDYHLAFVIDELHRAKIGKDNYNLFPDWKEPKMIDEEVCLKIKKFIDGGK